MSFTISLNGISNAQTELNVISNNLANANTTGFKQSSVNFANLVAQSSSGSPDASGNPEDTQGIGSVVQSIDQDFTAGSMQNTGSATDIAVNGNGFFTTVNPTSQQTYYTRNGNFSVNGSGGLIDSLGNQVQMLPVSSTGAASSTTPQSVQIPLTNAAGSAYSSVAISSSGTISATYADGTTATIGTVALASFVSPSGLLQTGDQDWQATGLSGTATYNSAGSTGLGTILSGSLEGSNVDVSTQLVDLISAQQYFQGNAKAITTSSQMISDIMNATQ